MKLQLHLQKATFSKKDLPSRAQFKRCVQQALLGAQYIIPPPYRNVEITLRLADEAESAELNQQYRHKSGPTNILSFPTDNWQLADAYYLGDLLICSPLVFKEAQEQGKNSLAHWMHLTTHGVLHLLGYDHEEESQAVIMEALEVDILQRLGYTNPYLMSMLS